MPTNDFLPFGGAVGANVMTQSDYAALATRLSGFASGTASSAQLNKTWRQASLIASMLAQFIVDQSGQNAVDDGTTATLEANLLIAIRAAGRQATILADTGAVNAYTAVNVPALAALPATGYSQRVNIATLNTGASTYAPDGLTAKPIYGLGLQPLQGGELPVGVVVLMYLVQAGVNGGNGAWIIIESLGGAQQIAAATKSQHAMQLGQASGVVGQARNVRMYVQAASASGTLTADEVIVESALGGLRYCVAAVNKAINLATTGAGGMDTGTAPVSGFVALYLIFNPTTQVSALLATNANSLVGQVYGGANMPAGYTASALVAVLPTSASSLFKPFFLRDRKVSLASTTAISTPTTAPSPVALSVSTIAPPNAISIGGGIGMNCSVSSQLSVAIFSDAVNGLGQQGVSVTTTAASGSYEVDVTVAQFIYYTAASTAGTPLFIITIGFYRF